MPSKKHFHHLTSSVRTSIDHMLSRSSSYRDITSLLGVAPSTISREVARNKLAIKDKSYAYQASPCANKKNCPHKKVESGFSNLQYCSKSCPNYIPAQCPKLTDPHGKKICNGCDQVRSCRFARYSYRYYETQVKSDSRISSRPTIRCTIDEFNYIDNLLYNLMKDKKQSIEQIYANYQNDISVFLSTIRNWFHKGLLKVN